MRFETRAVHAGQEPEPTFGAVNVPIYQTSTYAQPEVGKPKRFDYARTGNPTREALQTVLASLEGGKHGLCFASGMAAEATLLLTLRPGDHVLLANDVYGGTYRLLARVLADWGVAHDVVDMTDLAAFRAAVREETRVVWVETPTNPLLKVIDIAAAAELAHGAAAMCVVDNTFATPYLQRPLEFGADVALHSATKYLGGHSDVVSGVIATRSGAVAEQLRFHQNAAGAVPSPFDCWLVLRGLRTLAIRMDRACANAAILAEWLTGRPEVSAVHYPGLSNHPQRDLVERQMRLPGAMLSFQLANGAAEANRVAGAMRVFTLAESLGAVESLVEVPAVMTHASVAGSPLEVPADLVRLSVGIEAAEDLVADLEQALTST
jgi:cystathionine beta-lyase/cystathionine gamma-synthase